MLMLATYLVEAHKKLNAETDADAGGTPPPHPPPPPPPPPQPPPQRPRLAVWRAREGADVNTNETQKAATATPIPAPLHRATPACTLAAPAFTLPPAPTLPSPRTPVAEQFDALSCTLPGDDSHTPKITRARPHVRNTRAHPYNPTPRKAAVCHVPPSTLPRQTVIPCHTGSETRCYALGETRCKIRVWSAAPDLYRVPKVEELHYDTYAWKCAAEAAGGVTQKMGMCTLGEQGTLHVMVATSDPMAKAIRDSCAASLKGEHMVHTAKPLVPQIA